MPTSRRIERGREDRPCPRACHSAGWARGGSPTGTMASDLPYAVTAELVAATEGCSLKEARRRMREGLCGPAFKRGKRTPVLRQDYEKAPQRAVRVNAIGGAR